MSKEFAEIVEGKAKGTGIGCAFIAVSKKESNVISQFVIAAHIITSFGYGAAQR